MYLPTLYGVYIHMQPLYHGCLVYLCKTQKHDALAQQHTSVNSSTLHIRLVVQIPRPIKHVAKL